MKKIAILVVAVIGLVLSMAVVSAAAPGESNVVDFTNLGAYAWTSADTADVGAGNTYSANLVTNMSTYRWAGLTGNVTGNIVLGDSNSNQMFTWSAVGRVVYASTAGTIAWGSLADAAVTDMPSYITGGADSDNYTQTFTGSVEGFGSGIFDSLTSDYAATYNSTGGAAWKTYSLKEGANLVWASTVVENGNDFRGNTADYQMLLPEDGTGNDAVATSYNLWVELQ